MAGSPASTLAGVAADVVVRYKAYQGYGGRINALRALARRCPTARPRSRERAFDVLCAAYDTASDAVTRHRRVRPGKRSRFAESEDVDFAACLSDIDRLAPGELMEGKKQVLSFVIMWEYLR